MRASFIISFRQTISPYLKPDGYVIKAAAIVRTA
jgi:hypothetical protein